jgi:hypothetical protein
MDSKLIFILVTAGLLAYALYKVWQIVELFLRSKASGSWPTTTGKVVLKEVSVQRGGKGGTSYIPKIIYSYSVMGERYKKTISLGTRWWESSAEKAIHEVGDSLEVRYNPEKPNVNITDQEKIRFFDLFPILIILSVALGFLIAILSGVPITGGQK